MSDAAETCRNCGTEMRGEYCCNCGQREGRPDVHLRDVAGELLEDIGSLDSRLWRTLQALLFKPGFLTAEFIAGRKAPYIPPFRLYLVVSFVLFLMISMVTSMQRVGDMEVSQGGISAQIQDDGDDGFSFNIANENSPEWLVQLDERLEQNARRAQEDPQEFIEQLFSFLPQLVFVLVPLFALLIQLCYLGRSYHYLQHLVFALHFNCFMFMTAILAEFIEALVRFDLDDVILPLIVIYLPLALKRTYGDGYGIAIVKALLLLSCNAIFVLLGLAGLSVLALATL